MGCGSPEGTDRYRSDQGSLCQKPDTRRGHGRLVSLGFGPPTGSRARGMSHRGLRARGRLITDHLVDAPAAVPSGEPHPTHLPRVVSCELCGRAGLCGGWVIISVAVGRGRVAGIVLSIGDITRFPTADHLASHTRT